MPAKVRTPLLIVAQAIAGSLALLAAELACLSPGARAILGAPLPEIASLYIIVGFAVGVAVTVVVSGIARIAGGAPERLSLAFVAWFFLSLFVLRAVPLHQLTAFPPRVLLVATLAPAALMVGLAWMRRGTRAPGPRMVAAAVAWVLLAGLAASWQGVFGHRLPARGGSRAGAPDILFVLVDALRADRLSCNGYQRPTSPNIDALAREGTRFSNVYAHGNRTIISMPALFTSLYPSLTGARSFEREMSPLPSDRTTIAELCRAAGYTTFAMMSNPYLKAPFGLTQGFDRVEEFNPGRYDLSEYRMLAGLGVIRLPQYADGTSASATEVTDAALAWLARAPRAAPWFCYVHYMDVHHPYIPPLAYQRMFETGAPRDSIDATELYHRSVRLVERRVPDSLRDDEVQRLSDLYDGCIRYTDGELGRLFDAVRRRDDGRPLMIVFTADHGDEFQEHGYIYHNNVAIQELIRVPLVIWRSDATPAQPVVTEMVRHIDVLPTIAATIGLPAPETAMGRNLQPLMAGRHLPGVSSVAEGDYCAALIDDGWKIMHVDTTDADALFDLRRDAMAAVDVAPREPRRLSEMQRLLDAYLHVVEPFRDAPSTTANAQVLRQLESLGYVSNSRETD